MITLMQYLGPYRDHPQMQSTVLLANAQLILAAANELDELARADGVRLEDNPVTGCPIAGSGNGGARPGDATVGAVLSAHKDLRALDRYDLRREYMRWLLSYGREHCERLNVYLEHPQWTRSWAHLQIGAPSDGLTRWNIVFVPYADLVKNPPTCIALHEQRLAGVPEYPFTAPAKGQ